MYWKSFDLREDPFALSPESRFLFLNETSQEILSTLSETIEGQRGLVALTSPPGLGKTTLLFQFMERVRGIAIVAFVFQTTFEPLDILRLLWKELGIDNEQSDIVKMHEQFEIALSQVAAMGKQFVLVVDEAQNLTPGALETIRLLANFETYRKKIVQIVLAGHPELEGLLANPGLEHVKQRIGAYCRLKPLVESDTKKYVLHRLSVAGCDGRRIFTEAALEALHELSKGIPRTINIYAFQAMMKASRQNLTTIDEATLRQAVHDFEGWPEHTAPAVDVLAPEETLGSDTEELRSLLDSMRQTLSAVGLKPDSADSVPSRAKEEPRPLVTPIPGPVLLPHTMTASTAPALAPVAEMTAVTTEKITIMPNKPSATPAAPAMAKVAKRPRPRRAKRMLLMSLVAIMVVAFGSVGTWWWMKRRAQVSSDAMQPANTAPQAIVTNIATAANAATVPAVQASPIASGPTASVAMASPAPPKPKPQTPEAREIAGGNSKAPVAESPAPAMSVAIGAPSALPTIGAPLENSAASVTLKTEAVKQAPSVRLGPAPPYPSVARQRGVSGTVVLKVQVNEYGEPTKVQVVSGHPLLTGSARDVVRSRWIFFPATVDGKPVAGEMEVKLNFHP